MSFGVSECTGSHNIVVLCLNRCSWVPSQGELHSRKGTEKAEKSVSVRRSFREYGMICLWTSRRQQKVTLECGKKHGI